MVSRRRNQSERELSRQQRIRQAILSRRNIRRQRIQVFQPVRVELALTGRRRKITVREGCVAHIERYPALLLKRIDSDSANILQSLSNELLVGVFEGGLIKSHAGSQEPEDLRIRSAFTQSFDRGSVQHRVRVTVSPVNMDILELCCWRKYNIWGVRRV